MSLLQSVVRHLSMLALICCTLHVQAAPETLTISNSKAWKPYSYLDEDGEPAGILIDLWKSYGQANDVEVVFHLVDWQSSIDLVSDRQADIHAGLLRSEEREQFLVFGIDLLQIDNQLYFHHDLLNFEVNDFLLGSHSYEVGVVHGGYEETHMRKNYPNISLKAFQNNEEMINAALRGDILAFSADLQVANYYLYSERSNQDFIAVKHLYTGTLYAASERSNTQLLTQISTQFQNISSEEKQRVLSKWMHIKTVYPEYLLPIALSSFGLLVGGYTVLLRYNVRKKTGELAAINKDLKFLSETDALTGLSNRRRFFQCLEQFRNSQFTLTVVIIDIDDFKLVNDKYGHISGDVAIRAVANAIKPMISDDQIFGRIGGEEFAICCCDRSFEQSTKQAQRLCELVREIKLPDIGFTPLTISVGCAVYQQAKDYKTLADADKLMYQAKENGKNQVVSGRILPVEQINAEAS
ncbi:sensor domain-containing diguanylate cyclase [Vibrio methylphosphonaticus]|uniref:sensor domain-containing diguanylate cyclase n=1 Tax=Vibrio methylphosphonaticus TaxID=2946866 RepID=UPI00202A673C|nr:sensor domain-containing diguanylate cyclase [Vibrio methylphosphonaticus]MCL9773654.1 sensor domain-containing diguanylate cyclase [Vibrio methylphosphonaticus]